MIQHAVLGEKCAHHLSGDDKRDEQRPAVEPTQDRHRSRVFAERCVEGIVADESRIKELLEKNVIIVTALNPHIGYDNGAKVAKEALATGRSVRDLVLEKGLLTQEELDRALDLRRMTEGGVL